MADRTRSACTAQTPALVLAFGQLGVEVAEDVAEMLSRIDRRRATVTCFLALVEGESGLASLEPLEAVSRAGLRLGSDRRQAGQAVIAAGPVLQSTLEAAICRLRTHDSLSAAGLEHVLTPPLDLIAVADLAEAGAAGAILPAAVLLQDTLVDDPYGMAHLVLSAALLPGSDGAAARQAHLYTTLAELDALLDPGGAALMQDLRKGLGLEHTGPLALPVYLFDHRKEGTRHVQHKDELRVILGNYLLALLLGGLAQRLGASRPVAEMLGRQAFYSGAGATTLIFRPQDLIEDCAARLGADFLLQEIGPHVSADLVLASELAGSIDAQLGDPRAWLEAVRIHTPMEVEMQGVLRLGLHLGGLSFERVKQAHWAETIASYDTFFGRVKWPRYRGTMELNAATLNARVLAQQDEAIQSVPQKACLYPGGLRTARSVLEELDERLEDRMQQFSTIREQAASSQEAADLSALERAVRAFPEWPVFLARLVLVCVVVSYVLVILGWGLASRLAIAPALGWAAALAAGSVTVGVGAVWLWRTHCRLLALRARCVRNLERKYGSLLGQVARDSLIGLCAQLRSQICESLAALTRLEATLERLGEELRAWRPTASRPESPFRLSASDADCAEWAYKRWREAPEEMRQPLLEEQHFLAGWREATAGALKERLLERGRRVFAPIGELSLEEVLRHRAGGEAGGLSAKLCRGAVVSLRADFDQLGGGGYAGAAHYLQVPDVEVSSRIRAEVKPDMDWQILTSGTANVVTCCWVRHLIPLAALGSLTRKARQAYVSLEPDERRALHLFDTWAGLLDAMAGIE